MVRTKPFHGLNTSSNLVGNATMLLWYMGYDTGVQAEKTVRVRQGALSTVL